MVVSSKSFTIQGIAYLVFILLPHGLFSQENKEEALSGGKPIIQVFGNFEYNATSETSKAYSFWIGRAHLGYEYNFNKQFSGKIVLDVGRPTTIGNINVIDKNGESMYVSTNSKEGSYYTMTLKFASLQWHASPFLTIQAGGILQNHYITQEKFWGHRYLAETFQDRYYKTPSSDLGIISYFKINEMLNFDLALTNGEGFRFDQDPYGDIKLAGGVDYYPSKKIQTRLYYDRIQSSAPQKKAVQQLISIFAGYKQTDKIRVGAEYNYKFNHLHIINHDLFGLSLFGSYQIKKDIEYFLRYDLVKSNPIKEQQIGWNNTNTGKAIITGLHYSLLKNISLSLNYQYWNPDQFDLNNQHHILLSFEYKL